MDINFTVNTQHLIGSMPNRLKAVIKNKENTIPY